MYKTLLLGLLLILGYASAQDTLPSYSKIRMHSGEPEEQFSKSGPDKLSATISFLDAALTSSNAFSTLLNKESYRQKLVSLNNPHSSDLGFSLEVEIQKALKPILNKTRHTNTAKFSEVVSAIIKGSSESFAINLAGSAINPIFPTILNLVASLSLKEKQITTEDVEQLNTRLSFYFRQYEKLHSANREFDEGLIRIMEDLEEIRYLLKAFMVDVVVQVRADTDRTSLATVKEEELLLMHLDISKKLPMEIDYNRFEFPSDGLKTCKEIAYGLQRTFLKYQSVYGENYRRVKVALEDWRFHGKAIDQARLERSINELANLYKESTSADTDGLRLNTLFDRLHRLSEIEKKESSW